MIVFINRKCSTCQKALSFLEKNKVSFTVKEITEEPPSVDDLQKMLNFQNGNIKKLLNTSGLLYREMKLSEKLPKMNLRDVLTLLNQHGMLIKRPFLLGKNFGLTGFKEAEWSQHILQK